jgi:hypothetical protein
MNDTNDDMAPYGEHQETAGYWRTVAQLNIQRADEAVDMLNRLAGALMAVTAVAIAAVVLAVWGWLK